MKKYFNKKNSKFFSLMGAIILLISFIVQNYLYKNWEIKEQEMQDDIMAEFMYNTSVQFDKILLYTSLLSNDTNYTDAEKKEYISDLSHAYSYRGLCRALLSDMNYMKLYQMDSISKISKNIMDLPTFKKLRHDIDLLEPGINNMRKHMSNVYDKKQYFGNFFLLVYLVGSILLITGLWIEYKFS
jgi:hypothetical protein